MSQQILEWEDTLDDMGPFAGMNALYEHYKIAPKGAPSLGLLERVLRAAGVIQ